MFSVVIGGSLVLARAISSKAVRFGLPLAICFASVLLLVNLTPGFDSTVLQRDRVRCCSLRDSGRQHAARNLAFWLDSDLSWPIQPRLHIGCGLFRDSVFETFPTLAKRSVDAPRLSSGNSLACELDTCAAHRSCLGGLAPNQQEPRRI